MRRAAAGLLLAASVQVVAAAVVTRSGYPTWFLLGILPAGAAVVCAACWSIAQDLHAVWSLRAVCVATGAVSLAATACIAGRDTSALNVAEPWIGLGTFATGLAGRTVLLPYAGCLVVAHRSAF